MMQDEDGPEQLKKISDYLLTITGRKVYVDVVVVNSSTPFYIGNQPSSTTTAVAAALKKKIRKRGCYDEFLRKTL